MPLKNKVPETVACHPESHARVIDINDHEQIQLNAPCVFLNKERRELLDQSWAGFFKDELLHELFHCGCFFSRPFNELHTVLGTLILQQVFDLTDEQTVFNLAFDHQWQYSLNVREELNSAKYNALMALWNWRAGFIENSLNLILFEKITNKLTHIFDADTDLAQFKSNMKYLGRISILVQIINKFFLNLRQAHKNRFETIGDDLIDKYLPENFLKTFSTIKPSESQRKLSSVGSDLLYLFCQFKDCYDVSSMDIFKRLEHELKERNIADSNAKTGCESENTPLEFKAEKIGDVAVVAIPLRTLEEENVSGFIRNIGPHVKTNDKIVLDMSRIQFIDSSGCGALMACARDLARKKGGISLCGVNKQVSATFRLMRLDRRFCFAKTKEEAVKGFSKE